MENIRNNPDNIKEYIDVDYKSPDDNNEGDKKEGE